MPGVTENDPTYFAALLCLYSLWEFFLRRLWWKPPGDRTEGGRRIMMRSALMVAVLIAGTSGFLSFTLAAGYVALAVAYALYDYATRRGTREGLLRRSLEKYVLKQVLMVVLLHVVWRLAEPITSHDWYTGAETFVLAGLGKFAMVLRQKVKLILIITTAYAFMIDGGTSIVRGILGKFQGLYRKAMQRLNAAEKAASGETEDNVGEWIGILERIITLTLVLTGNITAIAFVLTAKSIARFKELEQSRDFAEYYLLGTSGSIIVALGAGILVRIVFGL